MTNILGAGAAVALAISITAGSLGASSLKGSPASMRYQHEVATGEAYTFLRTAAQVRRYAADGRLEHFDVIGYLMVATSLGSLLLVRKLNQRAHP